MPPTPHPPPPPDGHDLLLYVTGDTKRCFAGMIAMAASCAVDAATGRPTVGSLNICADALNTTSTGQVGQRRRLGGGARSTAAHSSAHSGSRAGRPIGRAPAGPAPPPGPPPAPRQVIDTVVHEIMHVLGFSPTHYTDWRGPDGKRYEKPVVRVGPKAAPFLATPRVTAEARRHFGCAAAPGAPLETEGMGMSSLAHWEYRLTQVAGGGAGRGAPLPPRRPPPAPRPRPAPGQAAWRASPQGACSHGMFPADPPPAPAPPPPPAPQHELMTAARPMDRQRAVLSRLTLAALEDSGWYEVDYRWGRGGRRRAGGGSGHAAAACCCAGGAARRARRPLRRPRPRPRARAPPAPPLPAQRRARPGLGPGRGLRLPAQRLRRVHVEEPRAGPVLPRRHRRT